MTDATSGIGTSYPLGVAEFTLSLFVLLNLSFSVCLSICLFLVLVLSVLLLITYTHFL